PASSMTRAASPQGRVYEAGSLASSAIWKHLFEWKRPSFIFMPTERPLFLSKLNFHKATLPSGIRRRGWSTFPLLMMLETHLALIVAAERLCAVMRIHFPWKRNRATPTGPQVLM